MYMSASKNVGEKIQQIRQFKNISIDDLATRSKLDPGQIQLIEDNKILPSLSPLIKIARVLGVRLGTFLDDHDQYGPLISRSSETTKGASFSNKNLQARSHMDFYTLANGKSGRHMEPFLIDIEPELSAKIDLSSHEGEEFLFVLEGAIEINYGTETYLLNTGDSIYYDSIIDHHVHSANNQKAKIIGVVYTPL